MDNLVFTKVRIDGETFLYPVSAIKRIWERTRTVNDERLDSIQFYGDDRWHECVDAESDCVANFEQSIIEYKGDDDDE